MNADLEKTLDELGGGYRAVVDRLAASPTPAWRPVGFPSRMRRLSMTLRGGFAACSVAAKLSAASVVAVLALAVAFARVDGTSRDAVAVASAEAVRAPAPYTLAFAAPDAGAVGELVKTQRADGSWGSDFLTRQNAAALRPVASASVAYRRAVRYLRMKGLAPLTEAELRARAAGTI